MSLIAGSTRWVLFLAAHGDAEHRHIQDLAFGLMCLEQAGVSIADIAIYIDGTDRVSIDNFLKSGTTAAINVKRSQDFFTDQANNTHENLVMFVTGHGGLGGLDSAIPITPFVLLNAIKSSPHLKQAVVYLGQCYAGIFNYIGAGSRPLQGGAHDPNVVFIGATNLNESLSSSTFEMLLTGPQQWPANVFLLFAFKWFLNPIDVDGDGRYTIIDSYKFAGALTNSANKEIRARVFPQTHALQQDWQTAKEAHEHTGSPTTQANLDAAATLYMKHLEVMYVHQECWILNAIPSQQIER